MGDGVGGVDGSDGLGEGAEGGDLDSGEDSEGDVVNEGCSGLQAWLHAYSASNWLGRIRSAWWMIFLYSGTTSSLTYSRPWSPITGSRTVLRSPLAGSSTRIGLRIPQKNEPGFDSALRCRSKPIAPIASTAAALGA